MVAPASRRIERQSSCPSSPLVEEPVSASDERDDGQSGIRERRVDEHMGGGSMRLSCAVSHSPSWPSPKW